MDDIGYTIVEKKLSPSGKRRNLKRNEKYPKRKEEALRKLKKNLEVETSSQVNCQGDQCDQSCKTENKLKIYVGRTHKDLIPHLDEQTDYITAGLVVKMCDDKKPDAMESEPQTGSPFDCRKHYGKKFKGKHRCKIQMLKEHLDDIKI